MADDTYRQRRPIQQNELNEQPQPDLMASFKASLTEASEADDEESWTPPMASRTINPVDTDGSDLQVQGRVPPQMTQAVLRRQQQKQQESMEQESPDFPIRKQTPAPKKKKFDERPVMNEELRVAGSNSLESLINVARGSTDVYEEIYLPSRGKFYNGSDGPVNGKLHLRPMRGEEEQILATPRFVKSGKAIDMIFNRCLKENYNSENFLAEDRMFLLVKLRGISYSQDYDVEVTCPFTNKKFIETIGLDFNYEECPDDFGPNDLEDELPTTGMFFKYRLITGADELAVQNYHDNKLNFEGGGNKSNDTLLYRTALMLEWIGTETIEPITDKREILQLLKKLPMSDISYLRTVTGEPPFGLPKKIKINSPYAFEDFDIELSFGADFFSPKVRKKKNLA